MQHISATISKTLNNAHKLQNSNNKNGDKCNKDDDCTVSRTLIIYRWE